MLAASTTTRKLRSASKISKQVILMKARGLAKPLREMIPSAKRHLLILAAVQIVKEPDATSVECMHVFPCFAHVNGSLGKKACNARNYNFSPPLLFILNITDVLLGLYYCIQIFISETIWLPTMLFCDLIPRRHFKLLFITYNTSNKKLWVSFPC